MLALGPEQMTGFLICINLIDLRGAKVVPINIYF